MGHGLFPARTALGLALPSLQFSELGSAERSSLFIDGDVGSGVVSYPNPSYSAALGVLHHQHALRNRRGLDTRLGREGEGSESFAIQRSRDNMSRALLAGVGGCSDPPGWMDPPGCEWTPLSRRNIELCTTMNLRRRSGVSGECLMRTYTPARSLSVRRSWVGVHPPWSEWTPLTQAVGYDDLD